MKQSLMALGVSAALLAGPAFAKNDHDPKPMPSLDHVFLIMMENHYYGQIIGNANAPSSISGRNSLTWRPTTLQSSIPA